jgi:hypothetical protein
VLRKGKILSLRNPLIDQNMSGSQNRYRGRKEIKYEDRNTNRERER